MTTPTLRATIKAMRGTITVDGVVRAHEQRTGERITTYESALALIDLAEGGELDLTYEHGYRNVEESGK